MRSRRQSCCFWGGLEDLGRTVGSTSELHWEARIDRQGLVRILWAYTLLHRAGVSGTCNKKCCLNMTYEVGLTALSPNHYDTATNLAPSFCASKSQRGSLADKLYQMYASTVWAWRGSKSGTRRGPQHEPWYCSPFTNHKTLGSES